MKTVRVALIAGSALLLALGGVSVVACGSDDSSNGFPTTVGGKDAAADSTTGTGNGDDNNGDDDNTGDSGTGTGGGDDDNTADTGTGGGGDDDTADTGTGTVKDSGTKADCGALAIPSTTEHNYCFHAPSGADDAGTCSGAKAGCCDTETGLTGSGTFTNSCVASQTDPSSCSLAGGRAYFYGCGQTSDCTGGKKCFIFPYADSDGGSVFIGGTCGYVPLGSGSACYTNAAAAPSGSTPTCVTDSDCTGQPNGNTKCNPVSIHSKYFGACTNP